MTSVVSPNMNSNNATNPVPSSEGPVTSLGLGRLIWVPRNDSLYLPYRHKFWQINETHVNQSASIVQFKVFKHALQSYFSKMKAGGGGATERRAMPRSETSHFKGEQKIALQIIKRLAVKARFPWRMF